MEFVEVTLCRDDRERLDDLIRIMQAFERHLSNLGNLSNLNRLGE